MTINHNIHRFLFFFLLVTVNANAFIPLGCNINDTNPYLKAPTKIQCVNQHEVCYDIVYVRYPAEDPKDPFVTISRGEKPYDFSGGADLMLLHPDGTEKVLVDCDEKCSVIDPFISYDAKTVYYVLINNPVKPAGAPTHKGLSSFIYKMALEGKQAFKAVQMTFDDGFDSFQYAGYNGGEDDLGYFVGISDLAPVPLSDGRILFTSNRAALIPFHPSTGGIGSSIQQLYTMDDHDGSAVSAEQANIKKLENSNLHMSQHPFQLQDGRIIFSSWQDAGTKFSYAMTSLMTINPDGSNLNQFTEPHHKPRLLEHFTSQMTDGRVISTMYYPSNNYGFGLLMRFDLNDKLPPSEPMFIRGSIDQMLTFSDGSQGRVSRREFDRKGTVTITPHTIGGDSPAPGRSGKYSMPVGTLNNDLLVAYSKGSVNFFGPACDRKDEYVCDPLQSGIYLLPNAGSDNYITNPSQLIKIKDDPLYNEIFPKPVINYYNIHGQKKPKIITPPPLDTRLKVGEANALIGTSSMYNRQSADGLGDPFENNAIRTLHSGTWTVQGADAGVYSNSEIYGVRIIATPAKPYTSPIHRFGDYDNWLKIKQFLADDRNQFPVARYSSYHGERWEILGEFPLPHKQSTDLQGNPDTSWIAKIPAEMPTFIQAIDNKGMTLNSELTWRALKTGEKKVDCGGCHAHATTQLDYDTTQSGQHAPIKNIKGINDNDLRIQDGLWDLTQNSIPLLAANNTVKFVNGLSYGVEFNRDVQPIFNTKCISCHSAQGIAQGNAPVLDLEVDAWKNLSSKKNPNGNDFVVPQRSRYIRVPQARQSLLVWILWGERLDGRTNEERSNDVDYPANHPVLNLSDAEKRTIARWIDLGGPIDYPESDGISLDGFGYTQDYHLPTVHITSPVAGSNAVGARLIVGFNDVHSGLKSSTLKLSYYPVPDKNNNVSGYIKYLKLTPGTLDSKNILNMALPGELTDGNDYVLKVEIEDNAGNQGIASQRFFIN